MYRNLRVVQFAPFTLSPAPTPSDPLSPITELSGMSLHFLYFWYHLKRGRATKPKKTLYNFKTRLYELMNLNTTFNKIYTSNRWIFGSGTGSVAINNTKYIWFLQNFLDSHTDIKCILDVGCGDWQIGSKIDWNNRKYVGIDVSDYVLAETIKKYQTDTIKFQVMDATKDELPRADIIILKDVLEHLGFDQIELILNKTRNYKYVLIQNDINILETTNYDIENGKYRKLDITKNPFFFGAKLVSSYTEAHLILLMFFEVIVAIGCGMLAKSALLSFLMLTTGTILTVKFQPIKGIFLRQNDTA